MQKLYTADLYLAGGNIARIKTTKFEIVDGRYEWNYSVNLLPSLLSAKNASVEAIVVVEVEEVPDGTVV